MKTRILLLILILSAGTGLAQQRTVLIEQFTNSGCPPCATSTPPILQFVDDNPADAVAIAYHTAFPYNDSMYHENPTESDARVAFYGVSAVPHSVVDGNYYSAPSVSLVPVVDDTVNGRKSIPAKYNILEWWSTLSGPTIYASIFFTSENTSNINDSLRAHVVVVEKVVQKSDYLASPGANAETEYKYVMRKMLPDMNGSYLLNRNLGGKDTIDIVWNYQNIKNIGQVYIVAFVQNISTKEVYQSLMFHAIPFSVEENEMEITMDIYPNPTHDFVHLEFPENIPEGNIEIRDLTGRLVYSEKLTTTSTEIDVSSLSKGMYMIHFRSEEQYAIRKLIVE